MPSEFRHTRRVEFAETDMAGILHFSNLFRYMEAAEHAFFRSLGHSVHAHGAGGVWGFARREASCRFDRPLQYEDLVEIHVIVRDVRERTIDYEFGFHRLEGAGERVRVAAGSMTVVCVAHDGDAMRSIPIPDHIRGVLDAAPDDLEP